MSRKAATRIESVELGYYDGVSQKPPHRPPKCGVNAYRAGYWKGVQDFHRALEGDQEAYARVIKCKVAFKEKVKS